MVVLPYFIEGERFVEYNDKIVAEIVRYTATVTGCIAYDFILFGNNFNI